MKIIKSATRIEPKDDDIEFDLLYEDGATDSFSCECGILSNLFRDLGVASARQTSAKGQGTKKGYAIRFRKGLGEVLLELHLGDDKLVELVLGHSAAKKMGSELIEAAQRSATPQKKH